MFITQIKVPDFRVLKSVDISFDKNFPTRIFPLGSFNGGGKSTLLQLIFILLHCSTNPERLPYLRNLLKGFNIPEFDSKKEILFLDIFDEEINSSVKLTFYACNSKFLEPLKERLDERYSAFVSFATIPGINRFKVREVRLEERIRFLTSILETLKKIEGTLSQREREIEIRKFKMKLREDTISSISSKDFREIYDTIFSNFDSDKDLNISKIKKVIDKDLNEHLSELKKLKAESETYSYIIHEINTFIEDSGFTFITNFSEDDSIENALIFKIEIKENSSFENSRKYLQKLSNQVYLAAPQTQVFLFLNANQKKLLFKKSNNKKSSSSEFSNENYTSILDNVKSKLDGLFTYDFLALDYILELFKNARNQDFKEKVDNGEYGNNYENLKKSLNQILEGKELSPDLDNLDISGVSFKLNLQNGIAKDLLPEDLSHGELKRLSIFIWLKYRNIQNALVLMDEIEIALHPDWQYQIVKDLEQWGNGNQYILATHSYQLCEAVTPKHVKELPFFKNKIAFNNKIEQYGS